MNIFGIILASFEALKFISIFSTLFGTVLFIIGIAMIVEDKKESDVHATG